MAELQLPPNLRQLSPAATDILFSVGSKWFALEDEFEKVAKDEQLILMLSGVEIIPRIFLG